MADQFTKLAIFVEHEGKPYAVAIEPDLKQLAIQMLATFCKNGRLQLVAMPDGYKFTNLADEIGGAK